MAKTTQRKKSPAATKSRLKETISLPNDSLTELFRPALSTANPVQRALEIQKLNESLFNMFGFQIQPAGMSGNTVVSQDTLASGNTKSFALPSNDDGAVVIQSGAYYGTFVDLEGIVRDEVKLITKYREMARQPECESCIDDIVNEAIVHDETGKSVTMMLDNLEQPDNIKTKINEQFDVILKLLNFSNMGDELFRRWYVDGRIFFHVILDETNPKAGIKELRYIDPRRIRKVREVQKTKDPKSGAEIIRAVNEYYVYNERGVIGAYSNLGLRIATDSIISVASGLMDSRRAIVLSYLDKAIKPLNQLRMTEDAIVIYRLSRAPERRIFYVDVGSLPKVKAEQYLRDLMTKYRNKLVYDANTGEIRNDRKYMAMLEDFWLPRREGSKGTEISTLPAGQNLGELADVKYFEKKLYKALSVPYSRVEQGEEHGGMGLGRTTEITRDEVKFSKFITRLRNRFATVFDEAMRIQLSLKGICSVSEWRQIRENIYYDFLKDNNFTELKEAELLMNRLSVLSLVEPFKGVYYSQQWIRKNVLHQDEEEIKQIDKEIEEEKELMEEQKAAGFGPGGMGTGMPPEEGETPDRPVGGSADAPTPFDDKTADVGANSGAAKQSNASLPVKKPQGNLNKVTTAPKKPGK